MIVVRVAGLLVCLACVGVGVQVIRAGNKVGWVTLVGGVVLSAVWVVRLIGGIVA